MPCARSSVYDQEANAVTSYKLVFPEYLGGYEYETESKGYLVGVKVVTETALIEFTVYDPARLLQEVSDEIHSSGFFCEGRLLVVPRVTKDEISKAIEKLSVGGFDGLI